MTINRTSGIFSNATNRLSPGGEIIDWVTTNRGINAVLRDNGVIELLLPENKEPVTIDTRSGLAGADNGVTPLQWSNRNEEIEGFVSGARRARSFGDRNEFSELGLYINGRTKLATFGENAVLVSELPGTSPETKLTGVAVYNERRGILSGVVEPTASSPSIAPRRDIDNALTYSVM